MKSQKQRTSEYVIQPNEQKMYPAAIDLQKKEYSKLRRWIKGKYGRYSESIVSREIAKRNPTVLGIKDYGPQTCHTKKMRQQITDAAEYLEIEEGFANYTDVMPGACAEHLFSRIGAYIYHNKEYTLHNCLNGIRSKGLAPHIFLEGRRGKSVGRRIIYDVWLPLKADPEWMSTTHSVEEFWRYGKFIAKKGIKTLKVEVWFDTRPWAPRTRMRTLAQRELYEMIESSE